MGKEMKQYTGTKIELVAEEKGYARKNEFYFDDFKEFENKCIKNK